MLGGSLGGQGLGSGAGEEKKLGAWAFLAEHTMESDPEAWRSGSLSQ